MIKLSHFLFCAACLILLIPFVVKAQNPPPPPPPPRVVVNTNSIGSGSGIGSGEAKTDEDSDDTKITGATVRGRVVYDDTGRPLRYGLVSLIIDSAARYPGKFAKTDENGEFVMRNVKEGTYIAYVKSEGVLTPPENTPAVEGQPTNDAVTKYAVGGLGEVQIVVQAKRGGAIGGRVAYSDGESAAGVKVEALRKNGERFFSVSGYGTTVGTAQTDDRGVYRLAGLPEGSYLIRVTEPASNNKSETNYGYQNGGTSSLLKTYYPEGDDSKTAKQIEVAAGQEQSSIDLTLPERKLYTIAGRIITKKERQPLEKFSVGFTKVLEADERVPNYGAGSAVNSKKSGAYTLTSLPKGKYRITVNQSYAYRDPKDTSPKPPEYPTVTKEVEITDKNIDDLTFEMPTASTLRGTIIFEGAADVPLGMPILAFSETVGQPPATGYTVESNAGKSSAVKSRDFQIAKMSAGKYRLAFSDRDFYVKSITVGGRDVTQSAIEINEGEDFSGIQILLAANSAAVKGKVTGYEKGVRAGVIAIKSGSSFAELRYTGNSTNVSAGGGYEIKLAPGDYLIFVITEKTGPKTEADAKTWFENITKDAAKITVKADETQTLNLTFPK